MGPWISECAAQFVPCVSAEIYHRRYREPDKVDEDGAEIEWPVPYWFVDIGATTMVIMLAAVDAGLASGFAGAFDPAALRVELGIPDEFVPIGVMPVGRPLPDVRSPSLKRGWATLRGVRPFRALGSPDAVGWLRRATVERPRPGRAAAPEVPDALRRRARGGRRRGRHALEIAARLGAPPWRRPLAASPALRVVLWGWQAGFVTLPHVHPRAEELFHVLAGRASFGFAGQPDRVAGPGELLVAPRGVEHVIRVLDGDPFVMLIVVAPNEDAPDETIEPAGVTAPAD